MASKTEGLVILSREVEELREELQQVKLNMDVLWYGGKSYPEAVVTD